MSNSGDDQPLAPRRSLHKTPPSADAPTQPVLAQSYAAGSKQRTAPGSPAPSAPPGSAPASAPPGSAPPGSAPASALPGSAPPGRRLAQTKTKPSPARVARPRAVRRARLRLLRIDPWSVTKLAFLLSIAFGIMCVVAVFLVMSIMSASGLWDNVNESIQGVLNQQPADAFHIEDYVSLKKVLGLTMLIAVLDVVLMTALATLGAFLYNLAASLLGGVELTLAEEQK